MTMFAIIDCNNFYVSCERLFRPDLRNKPVVVLSSNDGCVISRSNEAKSLGVKMGEPYFKIKALSNAYKIQVFSSNYSLYGDLSQRVMSTIESMWPDVELYSIDEAFLDLTTMPSHLHNAFCRNLQKMILQWTGIPTSIGIGPSKTLAKAANYIAKKLLGIPVFNITGQPHWLSKMDINDVWGIGRQWQKKLNTHGIKTAHDLAQVDAHVIQRQYSVILMRTVLELQGTSCIPLEEVQPKKQSIMSSKSFGAMQTEFAAVFEALSSHCARACEKARAQNLVAQRLYVFVRSNPFRSDLKIYTNGIDCSLDAATADTSMVIKIARICLEKIFKEGIYYKKVGVMLQELVDKTRLQQNLFNPKNGEQINKNEELMMVLDQINHRYGRHTLKIASEGTVQVWKTRSEMRSPCYTTKWAELAQVRIG